MRKYNDIAIKQICGMTQWGDTWSQAKRVKLSRNARAHNSRTNNPDLEICGSAHSD
jgi:hypothetical protein